VDVRSTSTITFSGHGLTNAFVAGIDLNALATRFEAMPSDQLELLLLAAPGTHAARSDASDQGLAFLSARQGGKTIVAALLAAGAIGGSAGWLWWLE
jgi:hypothetical protein